jgi:RNA polymerase sigma-70 factor (ECF subfamily)
MDTWVAPAASWARCPESADALAEPTPSFEESFVRLFRAHHPRLYRYLQRLSGEPELAADLVQDAFVRLYRRGSLPDAPEAWLISVALNLLRNARSTGSRRHRLLTVARAEEVHSDPLPPPDESATAGDARRRVRSALERLPAREQRMLLLQAEGYSYRDIAAALALNDGSVGTLLARARRAFLAAYGSGSDASR